MPALPDCDVCEFKDSPRECYALARGHRRFCEQIRAGRGDVKALVHAMTVDPTGPPAVPPGPSMGRKVVNFIGAAATHAIHGAPAASAATKAARLAICEGCTEYFDPVRRACVRPECGCAMDVKTGWADMRCPIGKWNAVPAGG